MYMQVDIPRPCGTGKRGIFPCFDVALHGHIHQHNFSLQLQYPHYKSIANRLGVNAEGEDGTVTTILYNRLSASTLGMNLHTQVATVVHSCYLQVDVEDLQARM